MESDKQKMNQRQGGDTETETETDRHTEAHRHTETDTDPCIQQRRHTVADLKVLWERHLVVECTPTRRCGRSKLSAVVKDVRKQLQFRNSHVHKKLCAACRFPARSQSHSRGGARGSEGQCNRGNVTMAERGDKNETKTDKHKHTR